MSMGSMKSEPSNTEACKRIVKYSSPWTTLHKTSHLTNYLITCSLSYVRSKAFENITYSIVSAFIALRSCCPKPGHQASFCRKKNKKWPKYFNIQSFWCYAPPPRSSPFWVNSVDKWIDHTKHVSSECIFLLRSQKTCTGAHSYHFNSFFYLIVYCI